MEDMELSEVTSLQLSPTTVTNRTIYRTANNHTLVAICCTSMINLNVLNRDKPIKLIQTCKSR